MSRRTSIILSIVIVLGGLAFYRLYRDGDMGELSPGVFFGSTSSESVSSSSPTAAVLLREAEVTLAGIKIYPALADTAGEQEKGLTSISALSDEQGMLYMLTGEPVSFWNNGMQISYDLVWIRGGKVVGIDAKIPPSGGEDDYVILDSPGPVDAALELASGWTERYGLKIGNEVGAVKL